ncbi:MAG: MFS transporter [Methanobacteriaceae archaeon]|nr:MFS transporter [Methanobacteriaceae archaeon]
MELNKGPLLGNRINLTIILGMFLWSFSAGIVNISLPTIAQYLDISTSAVAWVIIGHLLVLVCLLLFFGRLADYVGHKTIFIWGVLVFTLSSYMCGISLDFNNLLIFRLVQGIGSAMLLSVAPAIISMSSTSSTRGQAFGYISLATTLGLSTGYLAGGLVTEYLGWNWIFFLNVPLGILVLIMAQLYLGKLPCKSYKHQFDIIGAILSFALFLSLILSLEALGIDSIPLLYSLLGFIATLIIGVIFVFWELRHPDPLIDLQLFLNPYLSLAVLTGFLTSLVLTGTIFLVPFYLELVKSYSTDLSGLIVFTSTLLVLVVGPLAGWLSDKWGAKKVNIAGSIFLVSSLVFMAIMDETVGLIFIFIALAIRALSDGISNPANSKIVISHSPPGKLSSVSSLLNTARYLGLVMGVVIFETLFTSTITGYALTIEASAQGALEMTLPAAALVQGFQSAFYLGIGISVLIIVFSLLGNEKQETDEYD